MWGTFILMLIIAVLCDSAEFSVRTTVSPDTERQKLTNILNSLNEKVELQSTIREINNRLEKLDKHYAENKLSPATTSNEVSRKLEIIEQKLTEVLNKVAEVTPIPESCLEVKKRGNNVTGVFLIKPRFASAPFLAVCDLTTRGGGWTVILNRFDGKVDFYLGWQSYKVGFGNLAEEFWLGLENIHQLSGYQVNELLVELVESDNNETFASYDHFSVGSEVEGYALKTLGGFSGTAENSLAYHGGFKFTTKDKDQDLHTGVNCAQSYSGAWWYGKCHHSHLTGLYKGATDKYKGVRWGERFFLKKARMLIRPQLDLSLTL
ncbi:microfibril-associated glycoprotein 4-like [Zophobas morio]|uniref:microfibril-associated glycoprotein 4-like n=1 Tax=Zophobas morio TaxID=2755281 RepID=UPI0030835C52